MLSAVGRALYLEEPPPHVLEDRLAALLAGEQGAELMRELKSEVPEELMATFRRWTTVRTRFTEDAVEQAVASGVRQFAILGAGLDSFAYRRRDLLTKLRVYEVDQPESQEWKRRRLRELGVAIPSNLVFAPIDFERQTLLAGLGAAGFDFSAPAILSWIGVTVLLSGAAIEATLKDVAALPPGSRIVFTYDLPHRELDLHGQAMRDFIAGRAAGMGEPFLTLLEPSKIDELLTRLGFRDISHFGPDDAADAYFKDRPEVRFRSGQRLASATVGPGLVNPNWPSISFDAPEAE